MDCLHCDQKINTPQSEFSTTTSPESFFVRFLKKRYAIFLVLLLLLFLWSYIYNDGDFLTALAYSWLTFVGFSYYFEFITRANNNTINSLLAPLSFVIFYTPIAFLLVMLKKLKKEKLYFWYALMIIIVLLAAHGCAKETSSGF